jgi:hypothetical protein
MDKDTMPDMGYEEGTFAEGYAKGKADERARIALCFKKIDDTWGMLFLDDLFEQPSIPQKTEPLRYGED